MPRIKHLPKIDIKLDFFKKNKLVAILLGIFLFLLLVVIYPILERHFTKERVSKTNHRSITSNIFSKFNRDTLDEITITSPGTDTFSMKKGAGGWTIEDREVDATKLNRLFDSIETLSLGDLLSRNPKNHMELGVSNTLDTLVTLRTGGDSVTVVIGIPSAVAGSFYMRLAERSEVYFVTNKLRNLVILPKADWVVSQGDNVSPTP